MDFTLRIYRQLLDVLKAAGYGFYRLEDYFVLQRQGVKPAGKFVILRHDVDRKPGFALEAAKLEQGVHIKASYYFRIVKESFHESVIRQIAAMGHEIGYHYEELSLCRGNEEKAVRDFEMHLKKIREFYPVKTMCMHGSPLSKWDNRCLWNRFDYKLYGIIAEPYFDLDFKDIFYLTDTGRQWDNHRANIRDRVDHQWNRSFSTTKDIISAVEKQEFPDRVMISSHPERWTDKPLPWLKQLLWQKTKNIIKSFCGGSRGAVFSKRASLVAEGMKYKLVDSQDIDRDKWSDFVENHPEGNVFQTPEMFDLFSASPHHEPVFIGVVDAGGNVLGTLLGVIQTQYNGFLAKLTARGVVWGTPLIKDNNKDILEWIMDAYDGVIKKRAIYSQFRNLWQQGVEREVFADRSFQFEEHLDILVDLSQPEEVLLKQMHKERRHNIRRAENKGTSFRELTDPAEIRSTYWLIEDTYKRIRLPFPGFEFFENAYRVLYPRGMVRYFAAVYKGTIISIRIVLCYKDLIYDWWTGSLSGYKNKYPNDLLPWKIFLWGKEKGYRWFDFGGAGKPGVSYTVRDYKLKFGGQLVNYGRYEKVHKPLLMKTAKMGFKLWQNIG